MIHATIHPKKTRRAELSPLASNSPDSTKVGYHHAHGLASTGNYPACCILVP